MKTFENNKPIVLYVDDTPINHQLFQLTLLNKFNVISAESGLMGLHNLKIYSNIYAVISDYRMPNMTGLEFIHDARRINNNIPYIILSGFDEEIFEEAIKSGLINSYLRKPMCKSQLIKKIDAFYENKFIKV